MDPTKLICNTSKYFDKEAEIWDAEYSMLNKGSPELEVLEFLYCFVRLIKPQRILETGTYHGGSAVYMALALKENRKGKLITVEYYPESFDIAKKLFSDLGLTEYIDNLAVNSLAYDPGVTRYQVLFLDSEPQFRLRELAKFLPYLDPGGFIFVHDLHPDKVGAEWGAFEPLLGRELRQGNLYFTGFKTPRGLSLFQKADPSFSIHQFLQNV
jgi:predicted O-methyltransferase YrrM